MRKYLSDAMQTQSSRRQEKIQNLLEESRVGKEQLDVLFARLKSSVGGNSPLIITRESEQSRIDSAGVGNNLRQVRLRIAEMYRISNLISLLLNSHASILSAEVKSLEEDLATMEKMASNYAFLLSDSKAFDYANLEPFNDYNRMNRELTEQSPDRTGSRFKAADVARINKKAGVLTLPSSRTVSYNIYPRIALSNFVVSNNNLDNTTKEDSVTGWKTSYVSSSRISTSIPGSSAEPGAQAVLEYELPQPQVASSVRLAPFSEVPIHIESVKVFLSDESQPIELLDESIFLDREFELPFSMGTVARFQIHLNQRTFTRATEYEGTESRTRQLMRDLSEKSRHRPTTEIEDKLLTDRKSNRLGSFTDRDFLTEFSELNDKTKPSLNNLLRRILWDGIEAYRNLSTTSSLLKDSESIVRSHPKPVLGDEPEDGIFMIQPRPIPRTIKDGHKYVVGLKSVALNLSSPSFKGVFISSSLDAEGDIGQVRIKTDQSQYVSPDEFLDNKVLTSVEYSVSNDPEPTKEIDWKPILPIGQAIVESERLFPNEFGRAIFRFEADRQAPLTIYKNGFEFDVFEPAYAKNKTVIKGIRIPINRISSNDIFTVAYTPQKDATILKLDEITNFEDIPLTAAFDSNGAGESFSRTGEKNSITLNHAPYIDRAEALSDSSYDPVVVVVDDGMPAVNVTDYTNQTASSFPDDDDESYYYIQSGRKLLFNKTVEDFRVFYQYLENNVSFRVVLRCNTKDFVSPKVDYVHVKAKIRKPDQSL